MKKALISSVLFGVLAAGSAVAADLPVKAPVMKAPPPPVYSWTGCYLGGGGGYGMIDQEHDSVSPGSLTGGGPNVDSGGRGWFGTVQGGCDLQFNSFLPIFGGSMIIGAFADGDWGSIKGTTEASNFNAFGTEKIDQSWAAGGRLGWLPTDRFLTFVSGGYTNAHVQDINYVVVPGSVIGFQLPAHRNDGWFIGTGYEYQLGWFPGLTWKTEYRYADYGSRTDTIFTVPGALPSFTSHSHLFTQTLRSELVWRFNWGGAPIMSRY